MHAFCGLIGPKNQAGEHWRRDTKQACLATLIQADMALPKGFTKSCNGQQQQAVALAATTASFPSLGQAAGSTDRLTMISSKHCCYSSATTPSCIALPVEQQTRDLLNGAPCPHPLIA